MLLCRVFILYPILIVLMIGCQIDKGPHDTTNNSSLNDRDPLTTTTTKPHEPAEGRLRSDASFIPSPSPTASPSPVLSDNQFVDCPTSVAAETLPQPILHERLAEDLSVHSLFSSGAVLQRCQNIPVFGKGREEGSSVIVVLLKDNKVFRVASSEVRNGHWQAVLNPVSDTRATYRLQIRTADLAVKLELTNLKVGEVWLCSGQSNMWYPISATDVTATNDPLLRAFQVQPQRSTQALEDWPADRIVAWTSNQVSLQSFSAVCYAFGQNLRHQLQLPIGLIHASYPGSLIEEWIREDVALSTTQPLPSGTYGGVHNAMLAPLIPYAIKGLVWNQGEANAYFSPGTGNRANHYVSSLEGFVADLRTQWHQGSFPVVIIQISTYGCLNRSLNPTLWAPIRWAQERAVRNIPSAALVISYDQGGLSRDPKTKQINNDLSQCDRSPGGLLHPPRKKIIGYRASKAARQIAYHEDILASGPVLTSVQSIPRALLLEFSHVGKGLKTQPEGSPLSGFSICCNASNAYVPAEAEILGPHTVMVSSQDVSFPRALRYAWFDYLASIEEDSLSEIQTYSIPFANLYNSADLPTSPMSTSGPE